MIPALEIQITADPKAAVAGFDRISKAQKALEDATDDYRSKLSEIERAERSGLVSRAQSAAAIEKLQTEYKQAATNAAAYVGATAKVVTSNQAVTASNNALGASMRAANAHTTNLMFQFQDIGMMLAAGQSPLMLAMQQGTQVSGVFHQMKLSGVGALGGIKAALLATVSPMSLLTIGAIAGGAALVQWGVSALTAADNSNALAEAMSGLGEEIRQRELEIVKLQNSLDSLAQADVVEQLNRLNAQRATLLDEIARMEQDVASKLSAQYEYKRQQLVALDEQIAGVQSLLNKYDEQTDTLERGNAAAQILSDTLAAIDMSGAIGQASVLLGQLQGAAMAAAQIANSAYQDFERNLDPFGGPGDFQYGVADTFRPSTFPTGRGRRRSGGGARGGGSGRIEALQRELEALQEVFATEDEMQIAHFEKQQETLQEALENKLLTQQEYNTLMEQAQAAHNEKMAQIDATRHAEMMDGYAGMFGDLAVLMNQRNKQLFAIGKAAAIAQALIKARQAVMNSYEFGSRIGGPALGAAFAGAAAVASAANVQKIASTSYGGGGSVTSAGSSVGGSSGGGNRPTQNVVLDLVGATPSQAEQFQTFADTLTEMNRSGYDLSVFVKGA